MSLPPQARARRPADQPASDAGHGATFREILDARLSRRDALRAGAALAAASLLPLPGCTLPSVPDEVAPNAVGFRPIAPSAEDAVRVAEGHDVSFIARWGDPVGAKAGMPAFRPDASNTAAEQALQVGMHADGMQYFPLPRGSQSPISGLLALNHEYYDEGLLFPDGGDAWNAEKTRKSQAAVGVSILEVALDAGRWRAVRPSDYARRITASTPIALSGPAAGSALVRTAADPEGRAVLGTFAGCSSGFTPWGTYLSCEENFDFMFMRAGNGTALDRRYGIGRSSFARWHRTDERFDVDRHPNEPHRFGWVVEIDPFDPASRPVKRTAMGRFKHECAFPAIGPDRRIAFYMGDDEPFEYIYKFVTADAWNPVDRAANRDMLDRGTLYVARFDADGSGHWLPLRHGEGPLTAANGFADQAAVLVNARAAADALGATKMDRPEWVAVHPVTNEVYCTLTNNVARGNQGRAAPDRANPRGPNPYGHIVRWREAGGSVAAERFSWDVFAIGGTPDASIARQSGDVFACPDGLWFDSRGVLWVLTDVGPRNLNRDDFARFGNNQMLAVDPRSGEFRRFLTGPRGCELSGVCGTPDGRTVFLNVQHPGEAGGITDWRQPRAVSNWPDFDPAGRPRSATLAIRRDDGGIVGT